MLNSLVKTWNEAKKEPIFTMLYIGGVAVAIAFVMVYAIFYYVRAAPIYPEYNRLKTISLSDVTIRGEYSMMSGYLSGWFAREYLSDLEGAENMVVTTPGKRYVQSSACAEEVNVRTQSVTPEFFNLFEYKFLQGRPFDGTESPDQKIVIITDKMAQFAFGEVDNAMGKDIMIESVPYRVVGVVKQASPIASDAYAQIFLPNVIKDIDYANSVMRTALGGDKVYFTLKDGYKPADLQAQIDEIASRILRTDTLNNPDFDWKAFKIGPVTDVMQNALGPLVEEKSWENIIKQHCWILIILLIIPAINISGMIGAQMERKYSEIGIRRSFGATKSAITRQVLLENLYMTLAGGLLGLILAWIFILAAQGWLFDLLESGNFSNAGLPKDLSAEMLFAPSVFLIALAICVVLNLVSAYIPVRWTLRKQVVNYINDNK